MARHNVNGSGRARVTPETLLKQSRWLTTLARALVHGDADAADVVQQTYAHALASPPKSSSNLRSWLRRIAKNVVTSRARSEQRRELRELLAPRPDPPSSPEEAVARAELCRHAVDSLLALDDPYRATLIMRFFNEMSPEEVARAMRTPVETVRTRVKRGLAQLRARFNQQSRGKKRDWRRAFALLLRRPRAAVGIGAAAVVLLGAMQLPRRADASLPLPRHSAPESDATPSIPDFAVAPGAPVGPSRAVEAAGVCRPCSLIGVLRDDRGRPVAGGWVGIGKAGAWFWQVSDVARAFAGDADARTTMMKHRSRSTTTASDGSFRIDEVDPYENWSIGAFDRDGGAAFLSGVPLDHPSGSDVIDLDLVRCARIDGRVVDTTGHPIPGAWIDVVASILTLNQVVQVIYSSASCRADAGHEGEFLIDSLPGTRFELRAKTPDGLDSDSLALEQAQGSTGPLDRRVELVVAAGFGSCARGRIRSTAGAPARLAEELLPRLLPQELASRSRQPVAVLLLAERPPRVPCALDAIEIVNFGRLIAARDEYAVDLSRAAGFATPCVGLAVRDRLIGVADVIDRTAPPDLVADLDSIPDPPPPTPTGTVVVLLRGAEAESGVDPAQVEITLEALGGEVPTILTEPRSLGNGRFEFTGVPARECRVHASCDGRVPAVQRRQVAAGAEETTIELDLTTAGRRLIGIVSDEAGRPVGDAAVRLYRRSGGGVVAVETRPPRTNREGRFAFDDVADGPYLVVVRAPGFAPASIATSTRADASPVELRLKSGAPVTVQLRAPDAATFRNVQWRVVDAAGVPLIDDRYPDDVTMDSRADRCCGEIAAGVYTVEIWTIDRSWRGELRVEGATEAVVELLRNQPR
jgi:RNA polymerase sigma factor (sigma-70 family)